MINIKHILVTGGTGYIGSHTVVELLNKGYSVIIIDNFQNSSPHVLDRIKKITGKSPLIFRENLLIKGNIESIFKKFDISSVLHFAGLKSVRESIAKPLEYYYSNFLTVLNLLEVMEKYNVHNFIFSSSATVYDSSNRMPVDENANLKTTNPYGKTKLFTEKILEDIAESNKNWKISILRYFNPIGAHPSGYIGEDPAGIPNNLLPYILNVAVGRLEILKVYGDDYNTPDGTGMRDYIHVTDLAKGHIAALEKLEKGLKYYNMGTGRGYTVLELLKAFETVTNISIPYEIVNRRPGDVDISYANVDYTRRELGWRAEKNIFEMCEDAWRWQSMNPTGYK